MDNEQTEDRDLTQCPESQGGLHSFVHGKCIHCGFEPVKGEKED